MRTCALLTVLLAALGLCAPPPAHGRTAVYVAPASIPDPALTALSTRGDNAGYIVSLNQTLALLFDQPFGGVRNSDRITIFTLAPPTGTARAIVTFGVWNNGSPIIIRSQIVNAGNSLTVSNLFQLGCSIFQGCNYISITTDRTQKGAPGVNVDYIDINGEVVDVTAPAPEPAAWALMILGFAGLAWRLKEHRTSHRAAIAGAQAAARLV